MKCTLFAPSRWGRDEALLSIRLVLAYGFLEPAMSKLSNIDNVAQWFATLGIPLPLLNAYLAAGTELAGVLLLTLGLLTRVITLPLIVVMIVAITTVHFEHGFSAADNGYEIPFYYLIFLATLATHGAGKWSVDRWIQFRFSTVV